MDIFDNEIEIIEHFQNIDYIRMRRAIYVNLGQGQMESMEK